MRFSSHFLAVSYPTQSINGILQTAVKNPITYYTFYYLWKILDEFNGLTVGNFHPDSPCKTVKDTCNLDVDL